MAWLPGYAYRKPLVLTGGASGAQTDFQLDIDIAYVAAKMQADFDDIRFTQNNGTTLIDAWLESKVDSASAKTWTEFPTTPANTVEQTYYMYYGKVVANYWDGPATFPNLFDDFVDGDYTSDPVWTVGSGTWGAGSYYLRHSSGANNYGIISTPSTIAYGVWEWEIELDAASINNYIVINFISSSSSDQAADHYDVLIRGDGLLRLRKRVSGANTDLLNPGWSADSAKHTIKVTRDASNEFKLYLDGALQGTVTDSAITTSSYFLLFEKSNNDFDTLFNRKYVANPPTYAFGAEESGAIELSTIIATVTSTSASDLNILRPLASTIATATATNAIVLGFIRELITSIASETATSTADLKVLRELLTTISSTTSTSAPNVLMLRELTSTIPATTSASAADVDVLRELIATIDTQTGSVAILDVLRELIASISTTTSLSDIELLAGVLRELSATIAVATSTSVSDLNVVREIDATITSTTSMSDADLNVLRELISTIGTTTSLSDIELLTEQLRELVATIATTTSTSASEMNVLRELEAIIEATTALTTIELMITMWLTSNPTITRLKSEGWFE